MKIEPIKKPRVIKNKEQKKWLKTRREYLKNERLWNGLFVCSGCGRYLADWEVEVDHINKRSTHPHLKYEPTNFQILCRNCHQRKHLPTTSGIV